MSVVLCSQTSIGSPRWFFHRRLPERAELTQFARQITALISHLLHWAITLRIFIQHVNVLHTACKSVCVYTLIFFIYLQGSSACFFPPGNSPLHCLCFCGNSKNLIGKNFTNYCSIIKLKYSYKSNKDCEITRRVVKKSHLVCEYKKASKYAEFNSACIIFKTNTISKHPSTSSTVSVFVLYLKFNQS